MEIQKASNSQSDLEKESMLLNFGFGEDSWESLGLQGDDTNLEEIQSWIFIEKIDAEAPILWLPDVKNWLSGKDPDAGKDWRQEEKGTTEDEMVGWHHQLDGQEFEPSPRVGDGQRSSACCSPWGHKLSDMTERLNWTKLNWYFKKKKKESKCIWGKSIAKILFWNIEIIKFCYFFPLKKCATLKTNKHTHTKVLCTGLLRLIL